MAAGRQARCDKMLPKFSVTNPARPGSPTTTAGIPLYFTDAQALDERLAYVLARHPQLAGIAIWRLGGEDPGNWAVIRAQLASDGR